MFSVPAAEFDFGSHAKKQCVSVSNLMFARCNWAFVDTVEPEIELPKLYELFVTKFVRFYHSRINVKGIKLVV